MLECYHRRARTKRPWLQGLVLVALAPVLMLLARVRITGREHIAGGFILAANHPSQLDAFFVAVALGRRVRVMGESELYRPWTWPPITVTYGPPLTIEQVTEPSRESNVMVARQSPAPSKHWLDAKVGPVLRQRAQARVRGAAAGSPGSVAADSPCAARVDAAACGPMP